MKLIKKFCRLWWYHRHRWEQLAWTVYDAGLIDPGAPEPPFPRPQMPRWLEEKP